MDGRLRRTGGSGLLAWSGKQASPSLRSSRNAWDRVSNIRIFEYRFRELFSLADSRGQCAYFDDLKGLSYEIDFENVDEN